jgi:exopolysaccharide production protein ExoQ
LLIGSLAIFVGSEGIVHAIGRETNLTGRTEIWHALIPMAPNPAFGAGFESFWLGPRLESLWRAFPVLRINEAHNGYIEVYLNLGWVGVTLIIVTLIHGYRRAVAALPLRLPTGGLMVAYIVTAALYDFTEAGFRLLNPMWIFLLLGVVAGGGVAAPASEPAEETPSVAAAEVITLGPPRSNH